MIATLVNMADAFGFIVMALLVLFFGIGLLGQRSPDDVFPS